jgi:uncharacterized SAM-binding protein YcdF (DUF218 family)
MNTLSVLFLLRKLIGTLLTPSLWGYGAVVVGVVLLFFARTRKVGQVAVLWGATWLVVLSLGIPFDFAGRWLERQHPPLLEPVEAEWVVVLGGGHRAQPWLPASAHLNESAVFRMIEGVRVQQMLEESVLVFTGFGGEGRASSAEVGASVAVSLGVDPARIVAIHEPRTTGEEARAVRELVGESPVVLVTSATHMPRAVRLFEREGVTVIPAPTGHRAVGSHNVREWLRAGPHRIVYADAVMHEMVGLVALRWQ